MGRPPKNVKIIKLEGKSHRTKAELRHRQKAEAATRTEKKIREWPETKEKAHKEFSRVRRLMKLLDKDDTAYESVVNRYALLQAECNALMAEIDEQKKLAELTRAALETCGENMDDPKEHGKFLTDSMNAYAKICAAINQREKMLQSKRNMMFAIERENLMTIASQLRSIPKKPEKKANPLREALGG